jgi:pimeloyl-ACP methyl ester carboxylesterase
MTKPLAIAVTCLLLAPLTVFAAPEDRYISVIFKDGGVLRGYVWEKTETISENGQSFPIPTGIILLEEGSRLFFIAPSTVRSSEKRVLETGPVYKSQQTGTFSQSHWLPRMRSDFKTGTFDERWMRSFSFHSQPLPREAPEGKDVRLSQHLSELTTQWARMDAVASKADNPWQYNWRWWYRTRELSPEVLLGLLEMHKDLRVSTSMMPAQVIERRLKIHRFLLEVGYVKAAEKVLANLISDYPNEKKQLDADAERLKNRLAQERMEEIRLAVSAGRHEYVGELLAAFPKEGVDAALLGEVRTLLGRYDSAKHDRERVREAFDKLKDKIKGKDASDLFTDSVPKIMAELSLDEFLARVGTGAGVGRLEVFLSQFEQAERLEKDGKPHAKPEELLALAVSSWLLGSGSGEKNLEAAIRAWKARELILDYQRNGKAGAMAALKKDPRMDADTVAQLISYLPPPSPDKEISEAAVPTKTAADLGALKYTLQLPPEYRPSRSYPVLIALRDGGEDGADMVKRWGEEARRNGYILAVPECERSENFYKPTEHDAVLKVILDLRRRFQIDSDRIFLTGFGEGGTIAYDVALSHPDLFAGVIPVCAAPRLQARMYDGNAQHLPFYVVWGQFMGWSDTDKNDGNKLNQDIVEKWIDAGNLHAADKNPLTATSYPVLGVAYRGRGREWFPAEVPDIFAWMAPKIRPNPKSFGRDGNSTTEFHTMRASDNRFYWLSAQTTDRKQPANLYGTIGSNNDVNVVTAREMKGVTVWFARNAIDFSRPVQVRVNSRVVEEKAVVKPSVEVLLQDFADSGDRQRLYLGKWETK